MKFIVVSDKTIERAIVENSILGDMKSEKQLEKERLEKQEKERLEKERLEKENKNKNNDNVGAQGGTSWRMRLYRTVDGSRTDLPAIADYVNLQGDNGDTHYPCTSQIDSPGTTNAVTYTVSGERRSGSGNMYFNHQGGHSDEAESNIVLMEVSA